MTILQINSVPYGSTGKIMLSIHNELLKKNYNSFVVWGRGRKALDKREIFMNDKLGVLFHALFSRITGKTGLWSKKSTRLLIQKIDRIKPDIVHLHNVHGYYINIEILFNYLKKKKVKVVWTFHDCWPFTGKCSNYEYINCKKWQKQCFNCKKLNDYPKAYRDNSKKNFEMKRQLFNELDLTIVTPSRWLKNQVEKSFLSKYNCVVINNGIDDIIFKPTKSNFRKKYNIGRKKIILGVANVWNETKGYSDFISLSSLLDHDKYQLVMVGLNRKQMNSLPSNIIGLERTENQKELAEIYSSADVLFNPTHEDNYPTVNLEAVACGTPVITYNTGGSPESMLEYGWVIEKKDGFYNAIIIDKFFKDFKIENHKPANHISTSDMVNLYINLYNKMKG